MSQKPTVELLLPPGRLVWGDLYNGRNTDMDGRPLTYKNGPDAGKPRVDFGFGIAIKKGAEQHWASTVWGQQIWAFGHAAWPQGQGQRPDFAWKIEDGDSTMPNKKNRRPCDNPGYPGHWIVKPSSSIAPRLYRMGPNNQPVPFPDVDAIQPGDWVEAFVNITSNETLANPGIYINHSMVCWRGLDPDGRFQLGPNPSQAGFGQAAVAAGVSATPQGSAFVGTGATPPSPGGAPVNTGPVGTAPPPPTVATAQPPAYTPPGLATAGQGVPPPPGAAAPPVAPTAPVRVMLPKAGGTPYEAYIAGGWTDEQLRMNGYMQ